MVRFIFLSIFTYLYDDYICIGMETSVLFQLLYASHKVKIIRILFLVTTDYNKYSELRDY